MTPTLNILQLCDGRAGHDNQSTGLIEALARHTKVINTVISSTSSWRGIVRILHSQTLKPALIVGAGHATHMALLLGARRHSARSIVLMTPSLPCKLFDLCIVPEHDHVPAHHNIVRSQGALNRIQVSHERDQSLALILVGGPSRHFLWDNDALMTQIETLLHSQPELDWVIATSPRTPQDTSEALNALANVKLMRYQDSTPQWLPNMLTRSSMVWVSEDSVSMAYEALSSGAATGLIHVAARHESRIQRSIETLRAQGRIVDTEQWLQGQQMKTRLPPLQEADRCARHILERWPDLH